MDGCPDVYFHRQVLPTVLLVLHLLPLLTDLLHDATDFGNDHNDHRYHTG